METDLNQVKFENITIIIIIHVFIIISYGSIKVTFAIKYFSLLLTKITMIDSIDTIIPNDANFP